MSHPHDVANHGTLGRGHHTEPAWQKGQGTFAFRIEKTLGCQLLLELLESQRQGTRAGRLHPVDGELEPAARFVDGQAATATHLLPVLQPKAQANRLPCVHHAVELRLRVLQSEVQMSIGRALEPGHFAFHAQIGEAGFQSQAGSAHQIRHSEDARLRGCGRFAVRRAVRRRGAGTRTTHGRSHIGCRCCFGDRGGLRWRLRCQSAVE